MSRHPEVKWAQRVDKVFLTVQLPDAKNAKVNLEPEGVFKFTASAGADNNSYELTLELFDKVNVEESKINIGVRSIFCILEKAEKVWWKKLLRADGKLPHYVKIDWDKWVDEDEDDGQAANVDMGGMDFSNFNMGDMGGMAGMGGMPGMGGMTDDMGEFDDSDDEDEVEQPEGAKGALKTDEPGSNVGEKEAAPST
ncbi:Co-chaperone protein p23-1 [Euphorbia peplus]|nr:Co-chaperone protein p23-1 [Euphorbia peplus]